MYCMDFDKEVNHTFETVRILQKIGRDMCVWYMEKWIYNFGLITFGGIFGWSKRRYVYEYLFNDTASSWDYIAQNGGMTNEQWTGMHEEGSSRGLLWDTIQVYTYDLRFSQRWTQRVLSSGSDGSPPNCRLAFNRLHDVISQKIKLFLRRYLPGVTEENHEKPLMIANQRADICSWDLPNVRQECYPFARVVGTSSSWSTMWGRGYI
jgi:hypothetical protein